MEIKTPKDLLNQTVKMKESKSHPIVFKSVSVLKIIHLVILSFILSSALFARTKIDEDGVMCESDLASRGYSLPLGESVQTIRVNLVSKSELKVKCPKGALGCYSIGRNTIYAPSKKRNQGSFKKKIRIRVYEWGKAPCKYKLACWDGRILHTSFRNSFDHARQAELGQALSNALGFKSNCLDTIGHEAMHALGLSFSRGHIGTFSPKK